MTTPLPFPIDPVLTGVAIAYKNAQLIADQVAPRVPVAGEQFKYHKMRLEDGFTVPDTTVGRKSMLEPKFGDDEGILTCSVTLVFIPTDAGGDEITLYSK